VDLRIGALISTTDARSGRDVPAVHGLDAIVRAAATHRFESSRGMLTGMGGTVDPKTGEIAWEMNVPLSEQLAFYRGHPPCALGDLCATAVEQIEWKFDGHGEPVNSFFELACPCGSKRFTATCGSSWGANKTCSPGSRC